MRAPLALLIVFATAAHAQQDVGLVSLVSGEVGFQNGAAKPFMKVREGDRFQLGAGGELRLVYFASARQESWRGPAALRAGKGESAVERGAPPVVSALPASVPQRLARIPELAQTGLFGGVRVRGLKPPLEDDASLREARATYERLRRELAPDDPTPDLFLYAALVRGPEPDSEEVKSLAARLREREKK
jgi:hypothetical protein